jgi:hypothetical protein
MSDKTTGTEFTSGEQTSFVEFPEGRPGLPLMSAAGKKLASVSAPCSAFEVRTTSTEAVREK